MKIFTRYSIKQFLENTALSLMLFTFILIMDKIFQMISLLLSKGVNILSVFSLLLYSLPTILVLSMPMSILAGGILTFGRMAADGEITVIRTSGNSLKPVILPVVITGLVIAALMLPFNYYIAPSSQTAFRNIFLNIAFKDPALRLEESTLIDIPPYTLIALKVNHKKQTLKEILIYKKLSNNEPSMSINARSGTWHTSKNGELVMKLKNGSIKHQAEDNPQKFSTINFNSYTITLRAPTERKKVGKSIESMTGPELRDEIRRLKSKGLPAHKIETRYHLRGALAGAIPVLLITAIPFGIRAENKGKTIGIGMSLGIIAVYYFFMVAGIKLAFNESVNPVLGVWFPNIITGITGILLLLRSNYR